MYLSIYLKKQKYVWCMFKVIQKHCKNGIVWPQDSIDKFIFHCKTFHLGNVLVSVGVFIKTWCSLSYFYLQISIGVCIDFTNSILVGQCIRAGALKLIPCGCVRPHKQTWYQTCSCSPWLISEMVPHVMHTGIGCSHQWSQRGLQSFTSSRHESLFTRILTSMSQSSKYSFAIEFIWLKLSSVSFIASLQTAAIVCNVAWFSSRI